MAWHLAVWVFCVDYPRKKRETTWFGFDWGWGALAMSDLMERHLLVLALTIER
jgi:hypothetical protein